MQTRSKRQRLLHSSLLLREIASSDVSQALRLLSSTTEGLSEQEAAQRLASTGPNKVASARPLPGWRQFLKTFVNPFVLILVVLSLVSYITDVVLTPPDTRSWSKVVILALMILLSCVLRFWQEYRSQRTVAKLQAMVQTHARVQRQPGVTHVLPTTSLVPGDVILLQCKREKISLSNRNAKKDTLPWLHFLA